jgi:peroxiredoxin
VILPPGTHAPLLDGHDERGNGVMLPALERWTHLWFNPVFGRYGCKDCQTSLLHERYPDFRLSGVMPFGCTFDPPEINATRAESHVWRIPIIQIDRETAAQWGALRDESDTWYEHTPASVAYLIDPMGIIRRAYQQVDHRKHADEVLRDIRRHQTSGSR